MAANRIYYAVVLAISAALAFYYTNKITVLLFCAAIILPAISFLLQLFAYLSITVKQKASKRMLYRHDKVRINVFVRCTFPVSFAFIDVRVHRADGDSRRLRRADSLLCASFGAPSAAGFEISCPYRGIYNVGADSIRVYDMLGIFCLKKKIDTCKVTVYPRVFPVVGYRVDNRLIGQTSFTKNSLKKDDILVSHVRKYQTNDRPKMIHWKITSKMNELMVKDYEPLKEVGIIVLLDIQPKEGTAENNRKTEDKLIECVLSMVANSIGDMLTARVVYFKNEMISHSICEVQDYPSFYNVCVSLKFDGDTKLTDAINTVTSNSIGAANLVVVSNRFDEEIRYSLKKAGFAGFKPSFIRVVDDETDESWITQMQNLAKDGVGSVAVKADENEPIVF